MQTLLIFNLIAIIVLSGLAIVGWYVAHKRKKEIKAINFKAAKIFDEKQEFIEKQKSCIEYLEKKIKIPTYQVAQLVNSNKDLYPDN